MLDRPVYGSRSLKEFSSGGGTDRDVIFDSPDYFTKSITISLITACLASFLLGYSITMYNNILHFLHSEIGQVTTFHDLSKTISGSMLTGAITGAASSGAILTWSRRKAQVIAMWLFALASLLPVVLTHIHTIEASRFLGGMGTGLASAVAPVWINETAPPAHRASYGLLIQFFIAGGIVVGSVMGLVLQHFESHLAKVLWWKFMQVLPIMLCVIHTYVFCYVITDETAPFYLLKKDRENATKMMMKMKLPLRDIETSLNRRRYNESFLAAITRPGNSKSFLTGLVFSIFHQLCGVNVMLMNSAYKFISMGVEAASAGLAVTALCICALLGVCIAMLLESKAKAGRYPHFVLGTFLMLFSLLPILFQESVLAFWVCTIFFVLSFSASIGPLMTNYLHEIFAHDTRCLFISVCFTANWLASLLIVLGTHDLTLKRCYTVLLGTTSLTFLFTILCIRETKGLPRDTSPYNTQTEAPQCLPMPATVIQLIIHDDADGQPT